MLIFFHNLHHLCLFHWGAGHRSPHTAFREMDICVCPFLKQFPFPQLFDALGLSLMTKEFVTGAIILPLGYISDLGGPSVFFLCVMRSLTSKILPVSPNICLT